MENKSQSNPTLANKCVYIHRRQDGTPFYVGTGNPVRPWNLVARTQAWHGVALRENNRIQVEVVAENLSLEAALELEKTLIAEFGRLEDGGVLINRSTGGATGASGVRQTPEHRAKRSAAMKGKNLKNRHTDEAKAKISERSKKMWEDRRNGL
jgi:hypothetical protein